MRKPNLRTFRKRLAAVIDEMGPLREAEQRCGIPRQTLSRYKRSPKTVNAEHLIRLADATGVATDWLLGYEIPRERRARGEILPEVSRPQVISAVYALLVQHPEASMGGRLSPPTVRAMEAWGGGPIDILDRALLMLAQEVRAKARAFVAGNLDAFAAMLLAEQRHARAEMLREGVSSSDDLQLIPRLSLDAELKAASRTWRLEATSVRASVEEREELPSYFIVRSAQIEGPSGTTAQTRFGVPGGVAFGYRTTTVDVVIFFGADYGSIIRAERPWKTHPLLRVFGGEGPGETLDDIRRRGSQRLREDLDKDHDREPPEGTVLCTLSAPCDPMPDADAPQ